MRYHALREASGQTIEHFLLRLVGIGPRAALKKALAAGMVFLNGASTARSTRVSEGDVVEIREPSAFGLYDRDQLVVEPSATIATRILVESPELFVVDKPAGQACHPLRPEETGTTLNALAARDPQTAAPLRPGRPLEGALVHRLDRGTSGLLACARSEAAWERLRTAWSSRRIQKIYLAWLAGRFDTGGRLELALAHDPKSRKRMTVSPGRGVRSWKAVTTFLPIRAATLARDKPATLALIRIHTGVTHQIRATAAALGCPVLADSLYAAAPAPRSKPVLLEPDRETAIELAKLRPGLADLVCPRPELLPAGGFFLHALWLLSPDIVEIARGVTAPPPRHFGVEAASE